MVCNIPSENLFIRGTMGTYRSVLVYKSSCNIWSKGVAGKTGKGGLLPITYLVVDGCARRSEARAHDVRAGQHKLYGADVGAQLIHHVRVLVQQPQRGEPRPIPLCKEKRSAVHNHHLQVVWPAGASTMYSHLAISTRHASA